MPVDDVRVRLDRHEIAQLGDSVAAAELTLEVGWGVALDARQHAVRDTGQGAESIQPWPGRDALGPYADVSWDQDHFYMSFHEFGTRFHRSQPAVGPALDRYMHF
ncbi:hypothetical protein [Micromonospora tulbaghiae]|uniref:hypothetical protein n=1 Tax=Micromonospora tulbaghiae TaxID=479978 RepID=UPI0013C47A0F|nr:hypothetical protein [Micromonospora tulbaghiae]